MKTLFLSCLAALALVSLVGCACDDHQAKCESSSATYDSKDMDHHHHHHHADQ